MIHSTIYMLHKLIIMLFIYVVFAVKYVHAYFLKAYSVHTSFPPKIHIFPQSLSKKIISMASKSLDI